MSSLRWLLLLLLLLVVVSGGSSPTTTTTKAGHAVVLHVDTAAAKKEAAKVKWLQQQVEHKINVLHQDQAIAGTVHQSIQKAEMDILAREKAIEEAVNSLDEKRQLLGKDESIINRKLDSITKEGLHLATLQKALDAIMKGEDPHKYLKAASAPVAKGKAKATSWENAVGEEGFHQGGKYSIKGKWRPPTICVLHTGGTVTGRSLSFRYSNKMKKYVVTTETQLAGIWNATSLVTTEFRQGVPVIYKGHLVRVFHKTNNTRTSLLVGHFETMDGAKTSPFNVSIMELFQARKASPTAQSTGPRDLPDVHVGWQVRDSVGDRLEAGFFRVLEGKETVIQSSTGQILKSHQKHIRDSPLMLLNLHRSKSLVGKSVSRGNIVYDRLAGIWNDHSLNFTMIRNGSTVYYFQGELDSKTHDLIGWFNTSQHEYGSFAYSLEKLVPPSHKPTETTDTLPTEKEDIFSPPVYVPNLGNVFNHYSGIASVS